MIKEKRLRNDWEKLAKKHEDCRVFIEFANEYEDLFYKWLNKQTREMMGKNESKINKIIRDELNKILELTTTADVDVYQGNNLFTKGVDANRHVCICPNCGAKVSNMPGEACKAIHCPQCGNLMKKGQEVEKDIDIPEEMD